jgi:cell wall-associated NlpC family hydrolase
MQFMYPSFNTEVNNYIREHPGENRTYNILDKHDSILIAGQYLKDLEFATNPSKALNSYGGGSATQTIVRFGKTYTGSYAEIILAIANDFSEQANPIGSIDYTKYPEVIQKEMSTANTLVQQGIPYQYGGGHGQIAGGYAPDATHGLDCSSFVAYVLYHATGDARWDTTADVQYNMCQHISVDALQPGDLLFYGEGGSVTHVAMYIGSGYMAQEHKTGTPAEISPANFSAGWFIGAGRP